MILKSTLTALLITILPATAYAQNTAALKAPGCQLSAPGAASSLSPDEATVAAAQEAAQLRMLEVGNPYAIQTKANALQQVEHLIKTQEQANKQMEAYRRLGALAESQRFQMLWQQKQMMNAASAPSNATDAPKDNGISAARQFITTRNYSAAENAINEGINSTCSSNTTPSSNTSAKQLSLTTLKINGSNYDVRGKTNREIFSEELNQCGLDDAASTYQSWRLMRRLTNIAGLSFYGTIFSPIPAVLAGGSKTKLLTQIEALELSSPVASACTEWRTLKKDLESAKANCEGDLLTVIGSGTASPSVVRAGVRVSCNGKPVKGKTVQSFVVSENNVKLDPFESKLSIIQDYDLYTMVLMDLSGSIVDAGLLGPLQESVRNFLKGIDSEQKIRLASFDGRTKINVITDFTDDKAVLLEAVDSLASIKSLDSSTNLNGAIQQGVNTLQPLAVREDGKVNVATLVVFTDGADLAGRVSNEAALKAVKNASLSVYTIGLGTNLDDAHMKSIGKSGGFYQAADPKLLADVFANVGQKIANDAASTYMLAYCSPKRGGKHKLQIGLNDDPSKKEIQFKADGFQGGCSASDLEAK